MTGDSVWWLSAEDNEAFNLKFPRFNKWLTKKLHLWSFEFTLWQLKLGWFTLRNMLKATTDKKAANSTEWSLPVCPPAFQSTARTLWKSAPRRCSHPVSPWAPRLPWGHQHSVGGHREETLISAETLLRCSMSNSVMLSCHLMVECSKEHLSLLQTFQSNIPILK